MRGDAAAQFCWDLSAAFETVDLCRKWVEDIAGSTLQTLATLTRGVPQGSVPDPIYFHCLHFR